MNAPAGHGEAADAVGDVEDLRGARPDREGAGLPRREEREPPEAAAPPPFAKV